MKRKRTLKHVILLFKIRGFITVIRMRNWSPRMLVLGYLIGNTATFVLIIHQTKLTLTLT